MFMQSSYIQPDRMAVSGLAADRAANHREPAVVEGGADHRRLPGEAGLERIALNLDGVFRFGGRSLLVAVAVGLLATTLLILGLSELPRQQRETAGRVTHTLEVLGAATTLQADLAMAASEGRGFIIDRTTDSRTRFDTAVLQVEGDVIAIRTLTADNPGQQQAVDRLGSLIVARVAVLREIIHRIELGDVEGAFRSAKTQQGRALMDQTLTAIESIKAEERHLLDQRSVTARHATWTTFGSLIACGILAVASGLFAAALLVGRGRERKHLADLRQINSHLEGRVETRTADLAASEARYRLLAENSSDLIALKSPFDGVHTYVSPASHLMIGYTPEEFMVLPANLYVHPDDLERVATEHASLTADTPRVTSIHRVRHKAGHWLWVEAVFQLANTGTARESVVVTSRDVTERCAAEQALKVSEARYRLLADSTSDAITCVSLDFKRTYASPAFYRMFGYKPGTVIGTSPGAMIHPDDVDEVYKQIGPLALGEVKRMQLTYRVCHEQGHWVWTEVSFNLVCDQDTGGPASIVCSMRDISERHAQADELRRNNMELERLARHLTRARDQAERASRAKSRFLAGMSHELRTPLSGVLGYTQLLRMEGGLNAAQSARVDAMLGAGTHLLEMINCVLDLSQIEAERLELQTVEVDLRSIASACLDLVRPVADEKGVALYLVEAPDVPRHVMTDPMRLRQVLLNLLGNAVKFTAQGSVELCLHLAVDKTKLRIDVTDTGPGIPVERRHRLFQDFERLGADKVGTVEGAGLGLALSARLATLMGGSLGHDNNPGGGSLFWLELPLVVASSQSVPNALPKLAGRHVAETTFENTGVQTAPEAAMPPSLRVLVVDDVAMNRDIAGSFLRAAGHDVTCVEDGAEAIKVTAAEDFDVVLMDVRMPGMNGLEATRCIRAIAGPRGQVPIVALTAQAFAEQVEECRQAGMNGHLAKPFTPDALTRAVVLAGVQGRAEAALINVQSNALASDKATPVFTRTVASAIGSEFPVFNSAAYERTAAFLSPEVIASYLKTLAERSQALADGLRAPDALIRDRGALAEAAHALAGSAGMFGFERPTAVARRFEHAVQTGAIEVPALAAGLAATLDALLQELRRLRSGDVNLPELAAVI